MSAHSVAVGTSAGDGRSEPLGEADELGRLARGMLAERRLIDRHLDPALFADPALDILLFLFAEGGEMTTTACCNAARVPRTTALRWLRLLGERALLVTGDDASDGRMTLVSLTPPARDHMAGWLAEVAALRSATRPD